MTELLIAFGAGLISFLSPCVLPLIPGYVSFISGQSLQEILKSKGEDKDKWWDQMLNEDGSAQGLPDNILSPEEKELFLKVMLCLI